ncbi:MAG: hypothetical protein WCF65_04130 [Parachlamydiaceae bacterium]
MIKQSLVLFAFACATHCGIFAEAPVNQGSSSELIAISTEPQDHLTVDGGAQLLTSDDMEHYDRRDTLAGCPCKKRGKDKDNAQAQPAENDQQLACSCGSNQCKHKLLADCPCKGKGKKGCVHHFTVKDEAHDTFACKCDDAAEDGELEAELWV